MFFYTYREGASPFSSWYCTEWIRVHISTDDPNETTPIESLAIQYAVELAVTYMGLACTAILLIGLRPLE